MIGTVAAVVGAPTYSFSDKDAPDQATSTYTVRAYDGATPPSIGSLERGQRARRLDRAIAPRALTGGDSDGRRPVLTWQAPPTFAVDHYDIYRDGILVASTTTPATTFTDGTATEGVHDYAVRRAAPTHRRRPLGVLQGRPTTSRRRRAAARRGQVGDGTVALTWPAAADALSGVSGYVVRRLAGGGAPRDGRRRHRRVHGSAPTASIRRGRDGTWSYGFFAKDGAGNLALIGTVSNVLVVDELGTARADQAERSRRSRRRPKSKARASSSHCAGSSRRPPTSIASSSSSTSSHPPTGPPTAGRSTTAWARLRRLSLTAGTTGYVALFAYDHSGNFSKSGCASVRWRP